jgi:DNA-directed RNA polymerase specialized sigma24 family protein
MSFAMNSSAGDDINSLLQRCRNSLLQRCRHQDSAAATTLFDRYQRYVGGIAAVKLSPAMLQRIEAADIVQEVFLRFFRYLEKRELHFATEREFLCFLFKFTVNRIKKRAKGEWAAKRDVRCEVAVDATPEGVAPREVGVECRELLAVIRRAVAVQFGDGGYLESIMHCSNEELARQFGVSTKTVCRRMREIWAAIYAYDPTLKPRKCRRRRFLKPR